MNLFSDGGILISLQLSVSHLFYMFSYSLMSDTLTVVCWLGDGKKQFDTK